MGGINFKSISFNLLNRAIKLLIQTITNSKKKLLFHEIC